MRPRVPTILLAAVSFVVAPAPALAPAPLAAQGVAPAAAAPAATAMLRPGDAVRVTVWRQPDLSGEFAVGPDGSLSHPLYRDVRVADIALSDVEARLRTFLLQFEANPRFVVEPLFRVAVGGEVGRPNLYFLRPGTTLAQAVALAGGPTDRGRWDSVRLLRGGRQQHYDLTSPTGQTEPLIASGDQVLIERRHAVFRDFLGPIITVVGATAAILNATRH